MELFSIGYEGMDQRRFLLWLQTHEIDVVADVRDLPLSRKKGFSKYGLSTLLEENGIEYISYRNLGAPKELRSFLMETKDYTTFFRRYKDIISKNLDDLDRILDIAKKRKKVALLCYEKDPETCHRKIVADEVKKRDANGLKIRHLGLH